MFYYQQEITPLTDEDFFILLNRYDVRFKYPVHFHSDYELNLVMETDGQRIIGDTQSEFKSIDMALIGPNLPHAWRATQIEGNHEITIQFSEKILDSFCLRKHLFLPIQRMLTDSTKGIIFPTQTMINAREKIISLNTSKGFQAALDFLSLLNELATSDYTIVIQNPSDLSSFVQAAKSRRIAKSCAYIQQHLNDKIHLKELADLCHMSESAFSHFFKRKTNLSVIDYILNCRISKACVLLSNSSNTIEEISYECGFGNVSNFIRIFKKKKGLTPANYRLFIQKNMTKR